VAEVRGRGLLQGVEVTPEGTGHPSPNELGRAIPASCLEGGLHVNLLQVPGAGGVLRIAPPITITEPDLHQGLDILEKSLGDVA
jgi:2,2-dialkylglycine decarboxylase (pyruvate)